MGENKPLLILGVEGVEPCIVNHDARLDPSTSHDAVIWNDRHTMLEDSYGIFDANDSQYVATFLARTIVAKKIREKHDDEHHRQR